MSKERKEKKEMKFNLFFSRDRYQRYLMSGMSLVIRYEHKQLFLIPD